MNRKLFIFPILAAQMFAQQAAPAALEAEKALRDRVQQFYQLQIDKNFRRAEAFVADDTKDLYYNSSKGDLLGATITKVQLLDDGQKAKVTVRSKAMMMMMGGTGKLPIEVPSETLWKIENGLWVWYVDPMSARKTPFGDISPRKEGAPAAMPTAADLKAPNFAALESQVTIDRTSLTLTEGEPEGTVTITNGLAGSLDISIEATKLPGVTVEVEKPQLNAGEKGAVRIRRSAASNQSGAIHIEMVPLGIRFDIQLEIK